MPLICPECRKEIKKGQMFCPDCGTIGEVEDKSKKGRKTILPKEIHDYLNRKFDEVYAIGYRNVNRIDLYEDRSPVAETIFSRWLKESTSLALKDDRAYLSVEMMANFHTPPIKVAGNILVHSITDSAAIKYSGRRDPDEYILGDIKYPRFLLIVLPNPDEELDSSKELQMTIIEQRIKEMAFLEKTALKDFKICLESEFEDAIEKLIH